MSRYYYYLHFIAGATKPQSREAACLRLLSCFLLIVSRFCIHSFNFKALVLNHYTSYLTTVTWFKQQVCWLGTSSQDHWLSYPSKQSKPISQKRTELSFPAPIFWWVSLAVWLYLGEVPRCFRTSIGFITLGTAGLRGTGPCWFFMQSRLLASEIQSHYIWGSFLQVTFALWESVGTEIRMQWEVRLSSGEC